MRKISQFILAVLLMTALISHASAAISGQVRDTAGVGVQSTVQLLDASTKQVTASVSSDISGVYNFATVPSGNFFVRAVPVSSNYLTGETRASFSDGSSNVIVILSASIPSTARYVGINTACQLCHNNSGIGGTQFNSWKNTWHANAIHEPNPAKQGIAKEGVIGNFGQDPVLSDTANNIRNVTIDLNFDGINYTVKVGNVTYRADKVMGGFWKQRYLTKIGNSFYPLPVQWTVVTQRWVGFDLDKWFKTDGTNAPRYEPGDTPVSKNLTRNSWERRCAGCHAATGLNVSINAQGEYIAAFADMAVSCEGCHGPASEHILAGGGKARNIIIPSLLTYERASEVCGQCHNRGLAVSQPGASNFEYPYNIAQGGAYIPGLPLDDFFRNYSMKDAPAGNFWRADRDFPEEGLKQGDAIAGRAHREQWPDLKGAKHDTNSNERVSCANCHAPHGSSNRLGLVEQNRGKIVNNPTSLCLSCHQKMSPFQKNPSLIGIADGDTDHFTGIYDAMSGIGCIECHMVKTDRTAFGPDPVTKEFDQPDHTFKAIKPKFSTNGMPNSCTKCHTTGGAAARSTKWSFAEAQNVYDMTNVSVRNLSSTYVGAGFCRICHTNTTGIPQVYDGWNTTRHSSAFNRKFLPAVVNASGNDSIPSVASCRPCHTAGFGKPGGYVNFNTTPQLTNIQCENCHGAGSKHEVSANISAQVCGECHQGLRRPTITEWEQARHSKARDRFSGTDATKFTQCLDCHSGDFRLSKNKALITDATNTTKFGITCAVCHDMHSTVNPRQLRAATPTLMCAQCHFNYDNRGPDSAEPPHNFQVEMREARGGINATSIPFMAGVGCNECHMFTRGYTSVASPAITGHTFEPNTTSCKDCHVRESNQTTFGERHLALGFFKAGRTCDTCHAPGGFSAQGFIDTWKFKVNTEINNTRANITRAGNAATTSASKALFNISRFNFEVVNSSDKTRGAHNPEYALKVLEEANRVAAQVISGAVGAVQLYDANSDGIIQKTEAVKAVTDFFSGLITKQQAIDVVIAFFTGSAPSPTPTPTAVPPPATTRSFFANLSGAQEVPPTTSTAAGSGTFVLDTAANTLSFNIVFSGLSEAGAHIHGPAAAGAIAGILNPLPAGSPKTGVWNYLEVQEADILAGRTYVNIHSTTFPDGEIRGQILPTTIVEVTSSGFSPSTLTINASDTVTFVNRDTLTHWPASDVHPTHTLYPESGGCIGSKFDACRGLEQGEIFPFTFNVAGTWTYHDHLSPGFTGTIIVR